jgi:hypothetical protein
VKNKKSKQLKNDNTYIKILTGNMERCKNGSSNIQNVEKSGVQIEFSQYIFSCSFASAIIFMFMLSCYNSKITYYNQKMLSVSLMVTTKQKYTIDKDNIQEFKTQY